MAQIGTRFMKIEIDGTEYSPTISNARWTSAAGDTDFVPFASAAGGGNRDYAFAGTLAQDAATGSLWSMIFDEAGTTVPVTLMPYGNAVPSVEQPHFRQDCVITEPDGDLLGGEANVSTTARMTIDVSWPAEGKPVKVTTV